MEPNMPSEMSVTDIRKIFKQNGGQAMKNARKTIVDNFSDNEPISEALTFFSKVTLNNALPVFPALLSMAYQAVGGEETAKTTPFGEALVLISGAADLHDDVIDRSYTKGTKETVLGKFKDGTTILAGDVLLVEGLKKLAEANASLSPDKSKLIFKLVSDAVNEICIAQALEGKIHNKSFDVTAEEFLEVIRLKAVVPEVSMKIGAIIGGGDDQEVAAMANYGRLYGVNSVIFEELADLMNIREVTNRLKNECPPLPLIFALQNSETKEQIVSLVRNGLVRNHKKIVNLVLESAEVDNIVTILRSNAKSGIQQIPEEIIKLKIGGELENLLTVPLRYVDT
jgi:geranylgeranyl pyrophosphate synthase